MNKNIMDILKVISDQGHSGFSIAYLKSVLNRLIDCNPLTPLTGEDDEWGMCDTRGVEQNKRCTAVFRENGDNSTAHYIRGKIFSDNGGITWFTSKESHVPVTFPYMVPDQPEKVYIEYTEDVPPGFSSDKYEIITDKPDRIKALYEKKRKEFDEAYAEED